ncbi:MAG: rRNA pseudouridine synthase [Acidobacteria bacterium]|nr:MAG: rRNA pseudouridine synthase [Acidobacteriota bacterium]
MLERIQKILSRAGVASRRAAERLIVEGKVTVNGKRVDRLGAKADPARDDIRVGGRPIPRPGGPPLYYAAFKPRRMITSLADPEGRPTVADLLARHRIRARVYPVGRLDWDADGLLLLTNDGELAHRVMHPRTHLPKVYRVKVRGHPSARALDRVRRGVVIAPAVRTLPAEVEEEGTTASATWLRVTLVEGRQGQIKRMFERVGHPVQRLRRVAIGPLRLGRMKVGEVRPLREREIRALRRAVGLEPQGAAKGARSRPGRRKSGPRA